MFTFSKTTLLILLVAVLFGNTASKFKITNIKCHSMNESFAKFKTCRLKAVRRNVNEVTIYVQLLQLPIDNLKVQLKLMKRNDYRNRSIYQYNIDACAFLRNKRRNPLAELFYNFLGLLSHSNANHSCPYNHDFILDRYAIDDRFVYFIPLPVGVYVIYTYWETDGVSRMNVEAVIEVYDK